MNRFRLAYTLIPAMCVLLSCSVQEDTGRAGVPEAVIRENTIGTAYLGQQEWAQAADAFRRGLSMLERDPLLLSNLGVALLQAGMPDEAEAQLRAAVAADPGYPYANYSLGLVESDRGNFAEAAEHFNVVAAFDPADVFTQYNLGVAYSSLGRSDEAVAALRRALQLDPDHVSTLYALGRELVTQGERDEGRELISRSQEIRQRSGLDNAVGSQYGEQGPYALGADYPGDALRAPAPIDVAFAVAQRHVTESRGTWALTRMAPGNDPALLLADGGSLGRLAIDGGFVELLPAFPAGGAVVALAAGDGDNDQVVELYALLAGQGEAARLVAVEQSESGQLAWADTIPTSGSFRIPAEITVADMILVDREHDGDLDLFVCWSAPVGPSCALGTNDGSGRFDLQLSAEHGFDIELAAAEFIGLAQSDFDNDRDIDLLVFESRGVHILSNQRDGNFLSIGREVGLDADISGLSTGAVADLNKDGWMDLLAGGARGLELLVNRRGSFEAPVPVSNGTAGVDTIAVIDVDNDGFLDLMVSGSAGAQAYRNIGNGEWREETDWLAGVGDEAPVAAFDADGDGDLDVASAGANHIAVLRNQGGNLQSWIAVESRGVGDNRFGVGAKIEVLAGVLRQKFEVTSPLPVHAGLGTREQVDSVRYLWPSGVLQDEIRQTGGSLVEITQLDRKGTSCPILYVWRDGEWQFVTDFLGGSAIGYQMSPGVFSTPDTDEYIKLVQAPSIDENGNLRLRVNNQLQETIWFDQLELVAVDHPSGTEAFPNERLMPGPPWPEFELFVSDDVRAIASARSLENGADRTAELMSADGRYVADFELLKYKGYAQAHTLELDLGPFDQGERVVLLLDGWIDYADSTANVAAAQAGLSLTPPVLTVADGRGGWVETGHLMGFPAGLPKTMTVDVSRLFASDDHRIRIATNMRIYWDQARILVGGTESDVRAQRLAADSAELRYGGFPRELGRESQAPYRYDPASVSDVSPWSAHVGRYTAFGDVTDLVRNIDDRMVTTRSGDEIELTFRSPGPVPAGSTRTYLLYADGFGKDMDANSAANLTVGPMPFHGMPTYPYPKGVAPPADVADTMSRAVLESDRGWHGALPLPLALDARLADDAAAQR